MEMLADTGKVVSAEFVEVNPVLDQGNETAEPRPACSPRCSASGSSEAGDKHARA